VAWKPEAGRRSGAGEGEKRREEKGGGKERKEREGKRKEERKKMGERKKERKRREQERKGRGGGVASAPIAAVTAVGRPRARVVRALCGTNGITPALITEKRSRVVVSRWAVRDGTAIQLGLGFWRRIVFTRITLSA
jgi:hypothetical protein